MNTQPNRPSPPAPRIIAIITARGGSKGLPHKNTLELAGKPLIAHTIDAAHQANIFSAIYVSTEDDTIKSIARAHQAHIIDRPHELASDTASSLDVISHLLKQLEQLEPLEPIESLEPKKQINTTPHTAPAPTHFMLLQPTSPLRTAQHIRAAWAQYTQSPSPTGALVSVTAEPHPPHKQLIRTPDGQIQPLMGDWAHLTQPRQQLPQTYRINGAIYISHIDTYRHNQNLFAQPLRIYEMNAQDSTDIDTREDFNHVQNLLTQRQNEPHSTQKSTS